MNGGWVYLPLVFSYHNIIYYKTPFVKERLPKPIGHNDEFFGVNLFLKDERLALLPQNGKKEGVTPM